jgi:hypothetical protein
MKPDPKIPYPQTLGEAKAIIEETFKFNNWNEKEQEDYFLTVGISGKTTKELSLQETKDVLADMDKLRMVLFEKNDDNN